jgi:hypothetical protein
MKSLPLFLALAALLTPFSLPNARGNTEDEQAIRKVMSDFVDDVNRHDKTAFGKLLAEDAEVVVITGQYLRGRSEIEKYHAEIWDPIDKSNQPPAGGNGTAKSPTPSASACRARLRQKGLRTSDLRSWESPAGKSRAEVGT